MPTLYLGQGCQPLDQVAQAPIQPALAFVDVYIQLCFHTCASMCVCSYVSLFR